MNEQTRWYICQLRKKCIKLIKVLRLDYFSLPDISKNALGHDWSLYPTISAKGTWHWLDLYPLLQCNSFFESPVSMALLSDGLLFKGSFYSSRAMSNPCNISVTKTECGVWTRIQALVTALNAMTPKHATSVYQLERGLFNKLLAEPYRLKGINTLHLLIDVLFVCLHMVLADHSTCT